MSIYHGKHKHFSAKRKSRSNKRERRFWAMTLPPELEFDRRGEVAAERMMDRFKSAIRHLADRDVELEVEEMAVIFALHAELKRMGVRFDAVSDILLNKLREQAFGTSADVDEDADAADAEGDLFEDMEDSHDAEAEPDENDCSDWEPDVEDGNGSGTGVEDPHAGTVEGAIGGYVL